MQIEVTDGSQEGGRIASSDNAVLIRLSPNLNALGVDPKTQKIDDFCLPECSMTPPSMYLAVMGEAFSRLSEPVRRFHSLAGSHVFHGMVEVRAPVSIVAKLLAIFIGAPLQSARGPIRFELNAAPHTEVWTRFFRPKTMRSTFARADSHITERLGASLLTFALSEVDGALEMQLKAMKFLGIVCPAWLMPHVTARETGENDRLNFQVEAVVPLIGRVASYVGYLDIPREGVK